MPAALIRPTTPTLPETNGEPLEDPSEGDGQGRGEPISPKKTARPRKTKPAAGEKAKGRKLTLPDSVFDRLVLHAIRRGSTVSAIAAEILDRQLPHHRIVTDD
jgi:hypothetical protein